MDEKYSDVLMELGLSEKEVLVYLALLKSGESTVNRIARNSGLPRTTVYHLLENLIRKGFVSFVDKERIKCFHSTNPKIIIQQLEERKARLQEIAPSLLSISETVKEKPKTHVYEGLKGIKIILEDILEEGKPILHYGDLLSLQNVLKYAFPQFIKRRAVNKIPIKIICKKEEPHEELVKMAKKEYREFVFVSSRYKFPSSIFIYSKKVAILNLQEEPYFGILVENKDFFDSQKTFFELLWNAYK